MSEREGTAEDFARLFGAEPREPEPSDEEVVGAAQQVDPPSPAEDKEDEDGSQFLRQLFEPKRGEVEFVRSLHGDGSA
ncbi:MAG TPA: hypothetical protein VK304_07250 [Thermoleophilaceae bacterium]|nr:hypothetical protein [Thermoleophilaceae bacterium]